jgi:Zn finger protein HypA/HybF involved in hydrogenase expression
VTYRFHLKCPHCDYICWLTLPVREPAPQLDCPKCNFNKLKVDSIKEVDLD